jgi:peptidoglycan hydrolase CwlO-like protein
MVLNSQKEMTKMKKKIQIVHQKTNMHEKKNTKSQFEIAKLVNSIKNSKKPKKIFFQIMSNTYPYLS